MSIEDLESDLKRLRPTSPSNEIVESITESLRDETGIENKGSIIQFLPIAAAASIGLLAGMLIWSAFNEQNSPKSSNIALKKSKPVELNTQTAPIIENLLKENKQVIQFNSVDDYDFNFNGSDGQVVPVKLQSR